MECWLVLRIFSFEVGQTDQATWLAQYTCSRGKKRMIGLSCPVLLSTLQQNHFYQTKAVHTVSVMQVWGFPYAQHLSVITFFLHFLIQMNFELYVTPASQPTLMVEMFELFRLFSFQFLLILPILVSYIVSYLSRRNFIHVWRPQNISDREY